MPTLQNKYFYNLILYMRKLKLRELTLAQSHSTYKWKRQDSELNFVLFPYCLCEIIFFPLMLKFQNHFIFYFLCVAFTSLELKVLLSLFFEKSAFLLFDSNLLFLSGMNEPVGKEEKGGGNEKRKGRITQQLEQILLAWSALPAIGFEVVLAIQG